MEARRLVTVLLALTSGSVATAQWPATKTYQANNNSPHLVSTDLGAGNFRGWNVSEQTGTVTRTQPGIVDGLPAEADAISGSGKLKYSTSGSNWTFIETAGTSTAVLWRGRVSASPGSMPALQIGTGATINRRFRIDFRNDILTPTGVASGWRGADGTEIETGGKLASDGGRYLPMAMNEWHTVRLLVSPDGSKPGGVRFDAWVDEEQGTGEVLTIGGRSDKTSSAAYVQWGAVSTTSSSCAWATNFIAWGQNGEIPPINDSGAVDCDLPANCVHPVCLCQITPENTQGLCANGLDDDGDGLYDCADPDCAPIFHCGDDQPEYVLTLVRQIGHWQNSCNPFCGSVIFISVYDEHGNPLDGTVVREPVRTINITSMKDPGQGPDGQSGHGRHQALNGLNGTYRFYVQKDATKNFIASEITPPLYAGVAPDGTQYSWQLEFMRKNRRDSDAQFTPTEPTYIFDAVEMNPQGGGNTTLDDDDSDLNTPGGQMFGQTFVADVNRIVSARFELTRGFLQTFRYQVSIHELLNNPPTSPSDIGPQIGATRMGPANMIDSEWWTQMLNWPLDGADSVPVVPGQTYFAKITRADPLGGNYPNFTAFTSTGNYYPQGQAFRQPTGLNTLVVDNANYDVVGYIVGATIDAPVCDADPVFDVASSAGLGQSDGAVDQQDFGVFQQCMTGPNPAPGEFVNLPDYCRCMDINNDDAIDQDDYDGLNGFEQCATGPTPSVPANPACDGK